MLRKLLGGVLLVGILAAALLAGASYKPQQSAAEEPAKFKSYEELVDYIGESTKLAEQVSSFYGSRALTGRMAPGAEVMVQEDMAVQNTVPEAKIMRNESMATQDAGKTDGTASTPDYSGTNNQVQGVDEPDLVKTDGNFLYVLSGNKLFILRVYPANEAKKLADIEFEGQPTEAFINDDTLVVFGNGPEPETMFIHKYDRCFRPQQPQTGPG